MKRRIYRLESSISRKGPYHTWMPEDGPQFDTGCLKTHEVPQRKGMFLILGDRRCAWGSRMKMFEFPTSVAKFIDHDSCWKILELEIDESLCEVCDDGQVVFNHEDAITVRTFELQEFFSQPYEFYQE